MVHKSNVDWVCRIVRIKSRSRKKGGMAIEHKLRPTKEKKWVNLSKIHQKGIA